MTQVVQHKSIKTAKAAGGSLISRQIRQNEKLKFSNFDKSPAHCIQRMNFEL